MMMRARSHNAVRHAEINRAMNAANVWPEPMIRELERLCLTTASYGEIANAISALFPDHPKKRNAVIGKAKRLGLCANKPQPPSVALATKKRAMRPGARGKRSTPSLAGPPVVFKSNDPAALRSEDDRGLTTKLRHRANASEIAERRKGSLPSIIEEHPLTSVPVSQADRLSCQWPTSDDVACMEVCGAPAKVGAYCERHASAAYRVMPTIKRNRTFGKEDVEYRGASLTLLMADDIDA